jgi:hypothetical protein
VTETDEKAVWVFQTAIWEENDFLGEAALDKVSRNETWFSLVKMPIK